MKGKSAMTMPAWFFWALLSAVFAAGTAIFAKIGIRGVDSDLATLVRTFIIFFVLMAYVAALGKWSNPLHLPGKTCLFLTLSALDTGASWVCYFRALQIGEASVAPVDKFMWCWWLCLRLYFWARGPACANGQALPAWRWRDSGAQSSPRTLKHTLQRVGPNARPVANTQRRMARLTPALSPAKIPSKLE